jgi:cytochrome c biogenesis protein CcdA
MNQKKSRKSRQNIFILFFIGLILLNSLIVSADSKKISNKAVIYYNEACGGCTKYINDELVPLLKELGVTNIVKKDYANDKNNRLELNKLSEKLGVPAKMQGHFSIFIGDKIILQGHVPEEIIRDLFKEKNLEKFERIVVLQDEMEHAKSYQVWAYKGEIKDYSIDTPISKYLDWFKENKNKLETPDELKSGLNPKTFFPLLLVTGLLDGLNPCAFAVLLFFIAFLYTINRTKTHILKVGIIYIAMIYLAYLLIGLGILKAIMITPIPHFMAKLGAWLVIVLGFVNIKDYFWYGKWFTLSTPKVGKDLINKWMRKATIPATIVLGFLVGLCTFPCSGGPYVAILGLMAAKTTYFTGLLYLLIYNLMFVLPLIVILLFFSNRRVIGRIARWEVSEKRYVKLVMGILMILLGIIILVWFV